MANSADTASQFLTGYPVLCGLAMFLTGFAYDFVWARWSQNVTKKHAWRAANWSIGIFAMGMLYVMMISTGQFIHVGLYVLGAYVGTVYAVRHEGTRNGEQE